MYFDAIWGISERERDWEYEGEKQETAIGVAESVKSTGFYEIE